MKNSLTRITRVVILLLTIASAVVTNAQNCDQRFGGSVGFLSGTVDFRLEEFRHTTPTDLVWTNGLGISSLTCRGCYPGDVHFGPQFSKGGSATVTNYSREMVIEFSEPVA